MPKKCSTFIHLVSLLVLTKFAISAPKSWPYMKTYDIWGGGDNNTIDTLNSRSTFIDTSNSYNNLLDNGNKKARTTRRRKAKVLNFFSPFSVDDECLSDDGRRAGMCMNVYECRLQGGISRGDCALGFGACCVFETTCDQEVRNNVTYFVSPKFPALMPHDKEHCSIKIKLVSEDISQIRLDFVHFSLGQPNRTSGVCESDIFSMEGGNLPFILCGQNSGQHVFYDVGSPKARAPQELKINVNLNRRSVLPRLWEIRISQIPFSARAPKDCLQYFTGSEGVIQTFNFAENGRHLANQNYRSCIRQETGRCSIQYEPCDDNSFRIGPMSGGMSGMGGGAGAANGGMNTPVSMDSAVNATDDMRPIEDDDQTPEETEDQEETLDDQDGSGDDDGGAGFFGFPSFPFPTFFRSFSDSFSGRSRQSRQLFSPCNDRITLPCIVEDFIGAGMGDAPSSCVPVLCGNSLCQSGRGSACKIETSVTPFHIGVRFGDGKRSKGSPEDNIGACLRYKQLPCA